MTGFQKTLLVAGVVLIGVALLWPVISKLGLGRLPGDIRIERDGFSFFFPITTMVVISIAVTLLLRLFGRRTWQIKPSIERLRPLPLSNAPMPQHRACVQVLQISKPVYVR